MPSTRRSVAAAAAVPAGGGSPTTGSTPVPQNTLLVIGGTGTLGRQVVRRALDEGYEVRCIVRPRQNPADFLRDWGATTVQVRERERQKNGERDGRERALITHTTSSPSLPHFPPPPFLFPSLPLPQADLTDPTSLPAALVGIHTVIDCATARPEESTAAVDWDGKVALIQCAQAMGIQRFVFCSIHNAAAHPEVPLMQIKACTEKFVASSGLPFTTFRLCGFMQALIGNYAVPILEEKTVWGTTDGTRTAYLDSRDVARMILASLRTEAAVGQTMTLAGPKAYTVSEVIALCEDLAGAKADVTRVPVWLLKATRSTLRGFQWAKDAADRLAFADILAANEDFSAPMEGTYAALGIDPASITSLEGYLKDYYTSILKKLKEVGATSRQTDFYV